MNDIKIGDTVTVFHKNRTPEDNYYYYMFQVEDIRITNDATLYYGNYSKYHKYKLLFSFDANYWSWFDNSVFTVILNEFDLGI
jgi:hypothetical protein